MCSGSKRKVIASGSIIMEGGQSRDSVLLELAAIDDLVGFKTAVELEGLDVDGFGLWYGRNLGLKKVGLEERTPLMVASMFGSKQVLTYILETGHVDVNRVCGSDGATALHCAVAGGSAEMLDIVKLLIEFGGDANCFDVMGNRPSDLIMPGLSSSFNSKRNMLELLLQGCADFEEPCVLKDVDGLVDDEVSSPPALKDEIERKEYPNDLLLPDIKDGVYGTDEFRMYTFKIKPCSRAYSHDWTECPFVHPGENARRRDPRKYHYSCVPCPEFRKGTCRHGDNCEYAHGIFECWLHPAQYRTRPCKDEIGCNRKVCFFAHKPEELRPLYASTGSAVPSPRSFSANSSLDFLQISPLSLGSTFFMMPPSSTLHLTPGVSSPMAGSMWSNQSNLTPQTLQLSGRRLKTTASARDMNLEAELLELENHHRHQQHFWDELTAPSSPSTWNNSLGGAPGNWNGEPSRYSGMKPINLDYIFGSHDPTIFSQLQGLSLDAGISQLQSPNLMAIRQNMNTQLRASYPSSLSSSPARTSQSFRTDQAGAAPFPNARSAAFAKRSQSFIDRSVANHYSTEIFSPASAAIIPPAVSDWGSPDGKLDWGIQKEELNKLRKSFSFGYRSSENIFGSPPAATQTNTYDQSLSQADSMIKDVPPENYRHLNSVEQPQQYQLNSGGLEILPQWVEQFYLEQKQLVA